jgi:hypothetical protein
LKWAGDGESVMKMYVTEPGFTEDVAAIGTHAVLIRREVFEGMLGDNSPDDYDWFYYPRNGTTTEDVQFSLDAGAAGFRLGATTAVSAPHLCEITAGWETYQDYLNLSGKRVLIDRYEELGRMIADFTGETAEQVVGKAVLGGDNVRRAWEQLDPQTPEQVKAFYGNPENGYLYDLLNWNCTPDYQQVLEPLKATAGKLALVIGAGLGTEVDALLQTGNSVHIYELPGVLRDFCVRRFTGHSSRVSFTNSISRFNGYNLIVAVDVIEHIHPDEIEATLSAIYDALLPGGILHCHNNFEQQQLYPMHYDHRKLWETWVAGRFEKIGAFQWRKL